MKLPGLVVAFLIASAAFFPAGAENVLRWGSSADAVTLDPFGTVQELTYNTQLQIYEALVGFDLQLKLQPKLATAWRQLDETTWEFDLRRDVTFHNGEEFDSADAVFSFNRALSERSALRPLLPTIVGATAAGRYKLHVKTNIEDPILPNRILLLLMMDEGWTKKNGAEQVASAALGDEAYTVRNANGTGPFRLESRELDESTVFVRNPDWWGWPTHDGNVDRIILRPYASESSRLAVYLSGEIDLLQDPPLQDLQRLKRLDDSVVVEIPQNRSIFLLMDMASETLRYTPREQGNPLSDQRVREAIRAAIDFEAIQGVIMQGHSILNGSSVPYGIRGYDEENSRPAEYDLDLAKELLTEAGYPNGFTLQLNCSNNVYANDEKICTAIVNMLARIGITVKLESDARSVFYQKVFGRKADFFFMGWAEPTFDSGAMLRTLFGKTGLFRNLLPTANRLSPIVESISAATTLEVRERTTVDAFRVMKSDALNIPIHQNILSVAARRNVHVPLSPFNLILAHEIVISNE